jgi:peptidoglycan/xylan/chitin deacetylase (PgdA/CDA1 family)
MAQNSSKLTIQYSINNEIIISLDQKLHNTYGFAYPMTYSITIPTNSSQLRTYKRYSENENWSQIPEKTSNDFFNGVEAVRYDHANNVAYLSVAFSSNSDSIYLKIINEIGNNVPIEYSEVCKYYDNRYAVVVTTADDWCKHKITLFNKTINIFRSRNLWVSGAIVTDSLSEMDASAWQEIQKQLDSGYVEVLSHSRTHPHTPYDDYNSEIIGSKNDIIENLDLPELFRKDEKEYIYAYVNPYGSSNDSVDYVAGRANYLVTRGVLSNFYDFTDWNENKNIYEKPNLAYEVGPNNGGKTDITYLNQTFDWVVQNHKIYHFFIHPRDIYVANLWSLIVNHSDYISKKKNIWYTAYGHLYLYHFLQEIAIHSGNGTYLTVSTKNLSVDYALGSTTFTVTSNISWTVNDDVGWISTFPSSGSGNESVILIYEYNPNTSQRIGTITVSGGGITDTVLVRQDAKKFLTIFPLDTTLSSSSGVFNLIINSNTIWEIKEELDWINLNKYTGSNTDTINVNYDLNEDITDRDGLISIYGEKDTCEFIVRQIAHSYLFISLDTQTVSADTGSITVGVESNIRWCVLDSVDWIMVAPDTGEGVASVTVRYIANIDSLSRKGVLFFIGDTLTDKFILIQGGLEVYSIVALPDPDEGGTVTGSGKYLYGTNVKVIAFPSEGWMFKSWKEDSLEISNDSVYSFIAVAQRTLSAEFEKILTVTKNEKELPENFELYQNYPNPFNPTTTIKYSIPELSFVTLKIYDILGNEVATLINEEQSVGYYFVSVYASSMSSGIYFYQLKAGSYTQTKRMIILK